MRTFQDFLDSIGQDGYFDEIVMTQSEFLEWLESELEDKQ